LSEDLVFETLNEKRYAPASHVVTSSLVDPALEKELRAIPDKLAFKIGEVADFLGLKTYVLRYWETEFEELRPQKSSKNQRVYLRKDVELLFMIRKLLHRDRFSIEGARVALKRLKKDNRQMKAIGGTTDSLESLKSEVEDLLLSLASLRQSLETEAY
jgi:DNA-binding transcriptional MerR regulator